MNINGLLLIQVSCFQDALKGTLSRSAIPLQSSTSLLDILRPEQLAIVAVLVGKSNQRFLCWIVRHMDVGNFYPKLTIRIVSGPSELSQALLRITCKCNPGGSHVPGKFILSVTVWNSADMLSGSKHYRQVGAVVASTVRIQA